MNYKDKNVLVSGVAKSGIAAAELLKKLGAYVTIQDIKEREKLGELPERLESLGINLCLGKNPDDIIEKFDLIVLSPGVPCDLPFVLKAENMNIPVISEIELAYTLCMCPIIGVTGTNGKTTTTSIIGQIFKNYRPETEIVGNIGVPFSEKVLKMNEKDYIVAELSSFQLEKINQFKPKISVILNITPDHLNRHKTLENYIKAKERIFENQNNKDYLILNYDDSICRNMQNKANCNIMFFSSKAILENGVYSDGKSIYLKFNCYDEKIIDISELKILGVHNVENAMAAVAASICANIPVDVIRSTLKEFKAVEHRIEFVSSVNGVEYYNDSKGTNPDAAIKAINAMNKPIILIGGGYDKGSDFSEWIKAFNNKVKYLVVLGEVSNKIIETAKAYNFDNYIKVNSLKDAVDVCYSKAEKGDCVLLSPACASWDMFDSYEQRGNLFKDFVYNLGR